MRRIFCTFTLLAALGLTLTAQTIEEQKKEINRVKKNFSQYIYVEIIDSLEDVAMMKARHYLQDEIDQYVKDSKKLSGAGGGAVALNVKEQIITMPRGDRFRAFVYVKKSDILPTDSKPMLAQPVKTTPTRREQTIGKLLGLKAFSELETSLPSLQADGSIGSYAKYKNLGEPDKYVLVIYNNQGNIEAVLSEGPSRTNLRTGQADSESNYKGRGAFGILIKE